MLTLVLCSRSCPRCFGGDGGGSGFGFGRSSEYFPRGPWAYFAAARPPDTRASDSIDGDATTDPAAPRQPAAIAASMQRGLQHTMVPRLHRSVGPSAAAIKRARSVPVLPGLRARPGGDADSTAGAASKPPMERIAREYEADTGVAVELVHEVAGLQLADGGGDAQLEAALGPVVAVDDHRVYPYDR